MTRRSTVRIGLARALGRLVQSCRIRWYRLLSTGRVVDHGARILQPVLVSGQGLVELGRCQLGVSPSPGLFSGYIHLEAREAQARIVIADGVAINNNATLIAERTSITIGHDTLIGPEVSIMDSDFHGLTPRDRNRGGHAVAPVTIEPECFLGARVTVLKGVTIGRGTVIGNASVVTRTVPSGVVAAGQPCRVLTDLRADLPSSPSPPTSVDGADTKLRTR